MSEGIAAAVVFIVAYELLLGLPLFIIASKMRADFRWIAFIPLLTIFLLAGCAADDGEPSIGGGCLLLILLCIPLVNVIALGWAWANVAANTGQSRVLGWLCAIPVVNAIPIWIIAVRARRAPSPV